MFQKFFQREAVMKVFATKDSDTKCTFSQKSKCFIDNFLKQVKHKTQEWLKSSFTQGSLKFPVA